MGAVCQLPDCMVLWGQVGCVSHLGQSHPTLVSRAQQAAGGRVPRQPASQGAVCSSLPKLQGGLNQLLKWEPTLCEGFQGLGLNLGHPLAEIKAHPTYIYIHTYMCRHKFVVYGLHI